MYKIQLYNRIYYILFIGIERLESFVKVESLSTGFLDLSKAFNSVPYDILTDKLYVYCIRGSPPEFLSNMKDRKQIINYNGTISTPFWNTAGASQGNLLGPLLLIIYANDFHYNLNGVKTIQYVDDSSL